MVRRGSSLKSPLYCMPTADLGGAAPAILLPVHHPLGFHCSEGAPPITDAVPLLVVDAEPFVIGAVVTWFLLPLLVVLRLEPVPSKLRGCFYLHLVWQRCEARDSLRWFCLVLEEDQAVRANAMLVDGVAYRLELFAFEGVFKSKLHGPFEVLLSFRRDVKMVVVTHLSTSASGRGAPNYRGRQV